MYYIFDSNVSCVFMNGSSVEQRDKIQIEGYYTSKIVTRNQLPKNRDSIDRAILRLYTVISYKESIVEFTLEYSFFIPITPRA